VTLVYQQSAAGNSWQEHQGRPSRYGPGGYSPSHTHAKSAIIYATVIEGEVRSKVNDGPEKTYRTGENWTELPGDHHGVSDERKRDEVLQKSLRSSSSTIRTPCSRYLIRNDARR
jgi:quercetin dioxygenase-like cupin family protein